MSLVRILPVTDRRTLARFIRFPRSLYDSSSLWVSPLDFERRRFFDRRKNPFFEHAEAQLFLAVDDLGRDLGRIAAVEDSRHNEFQKRRVGFFGCFDSKDDPDAARALFEAAESWLRGRGLPAIHGPVNLSTNHECGLLVSGFDVPPRIQMTYNHPYYEKLILDQGYQGVQDLVAYEYFVDGRIPERIERARQVFQKRHPFTTRPLNVKRFREELATVKLVYNESWASNYGFVPLTDREIDWLASDLKPVLAPDLCRMAEYEGEPAGVMVILPDVNQVLRPLRGKLFPLGWWKLLRGMKRIDAMRGLVLGIRPRFRKLGIDYAFYTEGLQAAQARGYRWIELSWILAHNVELLHALQRLEARETKRYRLYEKALA